MVLFTILNRAIDLGEEIALSKNLGMPSPHKDIFRLLLKNQTIEKNIGI